MKHSPTIQTLLAADHIWRGQNKTNIIGIFDSLWVADFPYAYDQEMCIYIAAADVHPDTTVLLRVSHMESDTSVLEAMIPVPQNEKLLPTHLIIPIRPRTLIFTQPGTYAIDICAEGVAIKTLRIPVTKKA